MIMTEAKPILDSLEPSSQEDGTRPSHLNDGLRILARLIAQDMLSRLPSQAKQTEIQRAGHESLS
jgi:hypothetical protein